MDVTFELKAHEFKPTHDGPIVDGQEILQNWTELGCHHFVVTADLLTLENNLFSDLDLNCDFYVSLACSICNAESESMPLTSLLEYYGILNFAAFIEAMNI